MDFCTLLMSAKSGEETSTMKLFEMYEPLIRKESEIKGVLNEDLYQEQCIVLLNCIKSFAI